MKQCIDDVRSSDIISLERRQKGAILFSSTTPLVISILVLVRQCGRHRGLSVGVCVLEEADCMQQAQARQGAPQSSSPPQSSSKALL